MKSNSSDKKLTSVKMGKKQKEKKEKWSGLNKKEEELISSLFKDVDSLSKIYFDFILSEKTKVKSLAQKRNSLLKELEMLRAYFYLLDSYFKAIKAIRSSQLLTTKGRKVDIRARLIILILIIKFHKKSSKLPSGTVLFNRFEKVVLERNTEIAKMDKELEEEHKNSETRKKFKPHQRLRTSLRMCHDVLKDVKNILIEHPNYLKNIEDNFNLEESLLKIMKD